MVAVVISGHSGHSIATVLAYFSGTMDSEGQVIPFGQNKEERYLAGYPQGKESYPFHYNLLPPFSIPMKETKSLTPNHVRGFLKDMPLSPSSEPQTLLTYCNVDS